MARNEHIASIGLYHPGDNTHRGRLSRAILPEKAKNFALLKAKADSIDRCLTGKGFRKLLQFEHVRTRSGSPRV